MRDAFLEPLGRGLVAQIEIEEMPHPQGVVALVGGFGQAVVFALVLEHHHRLLQTAERVEILDPLIEVHGPIFVVVQEQERRLDILGEIDRRVPHVGIQVFPIAAGEPALAALEDRLVGDADVPINRAVHADEVGQGRSGDGGLESIGLRDEERRLITAPRVAM